MKTTALALLVAAMSVSAFGQTSVPAAPTLTAGAEIKGLRFDWDTVPGASWYQFEYRAHLTSDFVQQGDDFPATATSTHFSFPLHLFDWTYARYRLAACNTSGCSRSAEVSVSDLRRDAVGYFKSSHPAVNARFADSKDLSADGYNMVVAEPAITSQDDVSGLSSGGFVSVFRRGSDRNWTQRVRLSVGDVERAGSNGLTLKVAISDSGNTVIVGMPNFVPAPGTTEAGRVDIYHFKNGTWTRRTLPKLPVASMGTSVSLSDTGYILSIGVSAESGDHSIAIFKSINSVWTHLKDIDGRDCDPFIMSRNGRVIAQPCDGLDPDGYPREYMRVFSGSNWATKKEVTFGYPPYPTFNLHNGFAIDATGNTIAVQFSHSEDGIVNEASVVQVYELIGGGYSKVADFLPGAWRSNPLRSAYGDSISISGDGQTIVVGDPLDNGTGWGPRAAPLVSGSEQTGAVYVYRFTGGTWKLANMVKPNYNPDPGQTRIFGTSTALSGTGKTLIVAAPLESSSASGIGGSWANTNRASSGAVFMY
jgi:hypothetical protein